MIDSYKNDVINLQWINYITINDKLWKEKCRFTQKINVVTGEWKRQWLENDMQLWRKVELETVWKQWEDTSDNVSTIFILSFSHEICTFYIWGYVYRKKIEYNVHDQ